MLIASHGPQFIRKRFNLEHPPHSPHEHRYQLTSRAHRQKFSLHILFSIIASAVFATGQTVKTVVSSSLLSCSQACLRRSWCTSTNFNSLKRSKEGNCELNKHKFSPIYDTKLTDEPGTTFTMLLKVRHFFIIIISFKHSDKGWIHQPPHFPLEFLFGFQS